jgi:hypothetical protein
MRILAAFAAIVIRLTLPPSWRWVLRKMDDFTEVREMRTPKDPQWALDDALLVAFLNDTDKVIDTSDTLVHGIRQPLVRPRYSEALAPLLYHREVIKVVRRRLRQGIFGYLK